MNDIRERLKHLAERLEKAFAILNLEEDREKLSSLEMNSQNATFWEDSTAAGVIMQEIGDIKNRLARWDEMTATINDLNELATATDESDTEMLGEITTNLARAESDFETLEFDLLFTGPHDAENAILSLSAGSGGTDASDWAEMLMRMYLGFAEKHGYAVTVLHKTDADEAGIKSASLEIKGDHAFGNLKSEHGVHRLVRISPFDADKARHTSFALVEVIPEITEVDMEIPESDIRIDTYRASGHGGQGVNTTDSAVRLTHIPTGATVSVQNERSQLQNKATAMKILKARVQAIKDSEREKELKIIRGDNMSAEWGSQIRSYVIHPYQMVKDHRTGQETSDTQGVLGGELDEFIEAYLKDQGKS